MFSVTSTTRNVLTFINDYITSKVKMLDLNDNLTDFNMSVPVNDPLHELEIIFSSNRMLVYIRFVKKILFGVKQVHNTDCTLLKKLYD